MSFSKNKIALHFSNNTWNINIRVDGTRGSTTVVITAEYLKTGTFCYKLTADYEDLKATAFADYLTLKKAVNHMVRQTYIIHDYESRPNSRWKQTKARVKKFIIFCWQKQTYSQRCKGLCVFIQLNVYHITTPRKRSLCMMFSAWTSHFLWLSIYKVSILVYRPSFMKDEAAPLARFVCYSCITMPSSYVVTSLLLKSIWRLIFGLIFEHDNATRFSPLDMIFQTLQ